MHVLLWCILMLRTFKAWTSLLSLFNSILKWIGTNLSFDGRKKNESTTGMNCAETTGIILYIEPLGIHWSTTKIVHILIKEATTKWVVLVNVFFLFDSIKTWSFTHSLKYYITLHMIHFFGAKELEYIYWGHICTLSTQNAIGCIHYTIDSLI